MVGFQKVAGLHPDGVVGPKTEAALRWRWRRLPPSPRRRRHGRA
ncbi:peptidoglycan-binding protein [Ancylobacter sp. 3268]